MMTAVDFSRLLLAATQDTAQGNVFRLPWETGWAGVVLGGSRSALEPFCAEVRSTLVQFLGPSD